MKAVKNLTLANIKGTNFVRHEELDFSDDGNRFKGYTYRGMPITTLYSDGMVYCAVRPDYIRYNDVPFEMWHETEEYRLCDKYNGTSELIDLDDLANICDRVRAKLEELKAEMDSMDVSKQVEKIHAVLCREKVQLTGFVSKAESFNWFNSYMLGKLSDYDMQNVKRYLINVKKELVQVENLLKMVEDGTMLKKDAIHYANFASRGFVVVSSRFYMDEIEKLMNK